MQIKNDLYFRERGRLKRAAAGGGQAPGEEPQAKGHGKGKRGRRERAAGDEAEAGPREGDGATSGETRASVPYLFGHTEPSHVPESRGWWEMQRKNLFAITEDHEKGMMTGMVTLTQNGRSPELLAHGRRGPCAPPTAEERYEYLMARKPPGGGGASAVQKDPAAGVLSFQRRNYELKANFHRANRVTPLGISEDTFDRTEAQMRGALHAHILWWAKRRRLPPGYTRMPPVPAPDADAAAAAEPGNPPPRPRPAEQQRKEDHSYYFAEVARVNAELVRPLLDPGGPPELVQKQLCWAFLLGTVQTPVSYTHLTLPTKA